MTPGRAQAAALAAAVLFSTGGAAIKVEAFSAAQVSCVRSGIAAIALYFWARGRVQWSPQTIGIGAVYAAVLTLFVIATKLTTAANAIFLQSTAPIYILALAPWLLGERVRRHDLAYMGALATGLVLCFMGQPPATAIASNPALGNVVAMVCSVLWGVTLLSLRWAQRGGKDIGLSAVIIGNVVACLGALAFALPLPAASAVEWSTPVYLGVIQIALAYVFLTTAMRELPALQVSLLLLVEPVLNPAWTWLIRGEEPGAWVVAGGIVIIGATAAQSIIASRD